MTKSERTNSPASALLNMRQTPFDIVFNSLAAVAAVPEDLHRQHATLGQESIDLDQHHPERPAVRSSAVRSHHTLSDHHLLVGELVVFQGIRRKMGECQKPGALRRELDCLVAEASIQHCGPDLKHTMSTPGRPAHLPSSIHACVHQLICGI